MTTRKKAPTPATVTVKAGQRYVNLVRVHLTGGADKGKEFAPGEHVSDLGHLEPLQIQLLLNQRAYAPAPSKEND
jgi:hypothetical protein